MFRTAGLAIVSCVVACKGPAATGPAPVTPAPTAEAPPPTTPTPPVAQPADVASGYDKPPKEVLDVLHAPSPPSPSVNPTHDRILLVAWVDYPPMSQVAEPFLKLAGVRVEPRTRRKHDTPGGYGIAPCARGFAIVDIATTKETPIAIPPGGCPDGVTWSYDGKQFAFRNTAADGVELWVGDATAATIHRVGNFKLNPMLGSTVQWLPDNKSLLVKLVPDRAGPPPAGSVTADGPSIQETDGKAGESSTYEARDTLQNKHDEDLFDYYATSQLAFVDSATGAVTPFGKPAVFDGIDAAPDGDHVLVETIKKPYSYSVTYGRFAHDVDVWDRKGSVAKLAQLPLAERVPIHGVPTGPRNHAWRSLEPATVVWSEALDGGDWNTKVPARDKVMMQRAPFTAPAVEVTRTEQRFAGLMWSERKELALLSEYDENRHWRKTFIANVDDAKAKPSLLWDLSSDEEYADPGRPVMKVLPDGSPVVILDGDAMYTSGGGASPEGERPFLDRLDLKTRKSERLYRCDHESYEWFLAFIDQAHKSFLSWRQSPMDPPNAFVRELGGTATAKPGEAIVESTTRPITHIPDPTPAVRAIKKRLVKYKRKDGLDLSFTLYTPPNYKEGTRVPAILYAYPLDYASTAQAGQVTGSEQLFTRLRDYRLLLLSGYAIIDNAQFPVVGDPKKAYDTYLEQLVDDAKAAVDKAVATGVVDRERIGVTGHSHGAMMTANLIAHTDLFRAGVATSGAYNKVLTPFGFQSERRSVWKGRDVYLKVSPFFFADKIKLPLLIMHGADDANPGTTPLQARTFYDAIRGNGGTARLVMLPHEPHWYSAMESNEQLAFEEIRWFDKYVKNAPPKNQNKGEPKTGASP